MNDYEFIPKHPYVPNEQFRQDYTPEAYHQFHKQRQRYCAHRHYEEACIRMKATYGDLFARLFWRVARLLLWVLDYVWRWIARFRPYRKEQQEWSSFITPFFFWGIIALLGLIQCYSFISTASSMILVISPWEKFISLLFMLI